MGLFGDLIKLTKPMEEGEEDYFPGSVVPDKVTIKQPEPIPSEKNVVDTAAELDKFATRSEIPEPANAEEDETPSEAPGFFASLGLKKPVRPVKAAVQEQAAPAGPTNQVAVFTPTSFGEAAQLVGYLKANTPVIMTLDGIDEATARRLLDYMAGIACALQGAITQVGPKTFFVTAQSVDVLGKQP